MSEGPAPSPPQLPPWPGGNAGFLLRSLSYEMVVAVTATFFMVAIAFTGLYGEFQDLYLWLRPGLAGVAEPAPTSGKVAVLSIGTEDLYQWDPSDPEPDVTPRALLAEMVRFLDDAGARVIVLDILLDRPDPADPALFEAAQRHGAVIAAERFLVTEPKQDLLFAPDLSPTLGNAVTGGFANLQEQSLSLFSGDRIARRTPLVRRMSRARLDGPWPGNLGGEVADNEIVPAMALMAAWTYQAKDRDPATKPADLLPILAARCSGVPLDCDEDAVGLGLPAVPVGLEELLDINYRGPEGSDGLPVLRAGQVLRLVGQAALMRQAGLEGEVDIPEAMRAVVADKVVVVGRVDDAADDRFVTPFGFPNLVRADMSGCRIQAQIIDTLLSGRHVRHAGFAVTGPLSIALALGIFFTRNLSHEVFHFAAWMAGLLLLFLASITLFRITDGYVIDLGLPLFSGLVTLVFIRTWTYGTRA